MRVEIDENSRALICVPSKIEKFNAFNLQVKICLCHI